MGYQPDLTDLQDEALSTSRDPLGKPEGLPSARVWWCRRHKCIACNAATSPVSA